MAGYAFDRAANRLTVSRFGAGLCAVFAEKQTGEAVKNQRKCFLATSIHHHHRNSINEKR